MSLKSRVKALEQKAAPEKRVIIALEDMNQPGIFTIGPDPKTYTEAELQELDGPNVQLITICYSHKPPANQAAENGNDPNNIIMTWPEANGLLAGTAENDNDPS